MLRNDGTDDDVQFMKLLLYSYYHYPMINDERDEVY